jgi:hypothetical protein
MFHALLRRKLHPTLPEPERLEDALTSTLLGPLFWLEARDVLADWMGLDRSAAQASVGWCDYWFWPRLEFAEPDVVFRLGTQLVVVEAKFGSGRHDAPVLEGEDQPTADQIARQYNSIVAPRDRRLAYPRKLEEAVAQCRLVQVIAVDARRLRRARREYEESKSRLPRTADVRLVTWQNLYARLAVEPTERLWITELLEYMTLIGLDSFDGIGHGIAEATMLAAPLLQWRTSEDIGRGLRGVFESQQPYLRMLPSWHAAAWDSARTHHRTDRLSWRASAERARLMLRWGRRQTPHYDPQTPQ